MGNQVLAELSSVLLNKVQKPLPKSEVKQIIMEINQTPNWKKINYKAGTVEKALSGKMAKGHSGMHSLQKL